MKTEFTSKEIVDYLENLSPAEKGMIGMNEKVALDFVLDMHFEEYDTISLIELITLTAASAVEYSDRMKEEQ